MPRGWSKGYAKAVRKLGVGDSVVLPTTLFCCVQICSQESKKTGGKLKFVRWQVLGGTRIWRIA